MISSITNFPSITSLHTLSISNNNISDLSSFISAARTKYPGLKSLNTFKNPMNPGISQPSSYTQYKSYMKQIGNNLTELDGKNINDSSFMNQQQQPKRDLFGTSSGSAQPKRDLFGTSSSTTTTTTTAKPKVDFFSSTPSQSVNTNMNSNMNSNMDSNASGYSSQSNNIYASTMPQMTSSASQNKPKMGMFDNAAQPKTLSQSTNMSNMFANTNTNKPVVSMNVNTSGNNTNGIVYKRQFFVIDESAEIDGTEFVNSKKKKSVITVNEKILKKSDNMTKFNRKNKSEGNKHITNTEL